MKKGYINKFLYIVSLIVIFAGLQIARASETFQNNLLKMDVNQSALGGLKVTLYTNKPYNDEVIVNKKSDFEYIILLPETSNSLTAKPSLKSASAVVKDIEVKTQPYKAEFGQKGYTKIVISTPQAVEITPLMQTINKPSYEFGEKEYNELLAQSAKKQVTPTKQEIKSTVSTEKATSKTVLGLQNAKAQPQRIVDTKKVIKRITPIKKSVEVKPAATPIEKKITKAKTVPRKKVNEKSTQQVAKEIQTSTEETIIETPVVQTPPAEKQSTIETQPQVQETQIQPIGKLQKYKILIKKMLKKIMPIGIYETIAVVLIPIILILLLLNGAKKTIKKLKSQKTDFTTNLKEKPLSTTDYTENISDDMNWKEKFQTYVETKTQAENGTQQPETSPTANPDLDDLFGLENEEEFFEEPTINKTVEESETEPEQFEQTASYINEFAQLLNQDDQNNNIGENVSIESLFDEDEQIKEEHFQANEIQNDDFEQYSYLEQPLFTEDLIEPSDNFLLSEFAIDDNKGFYLVDFEDTTALVGHIEEEIFVLKKFDKKIQGPLQARLNEIKGSSVNYMTRVGDFKGIIEVTPENMNLLIEL